MLKENRLSSLMFEEATSAAGHVAAHLANNAERCAELGAMLRQTPPRAAITIARGSSDHAASYFSYLCALRGGRIVTSLPMSLLTLYRAPIAADGLVALAISQSGRSPDLSAPITMLREGGATTLALVNDTDSPLAQAAQWRIPMFAGLEHSVAATKTFLCSLAGGALLAAHWHADDALRGKLAVLPDALRDACRADWSACVSALLDADRIMVIGRGPGLAIAQEAALKFKETCGIQAEAFSGAEVKHGPMALIGNGYRLLIFALEGPAQDGLLSLAREMRARGARVLLAAPPDIAERDLTLATGVGDDLAPLLAIQSFYMMVEALSRARGFDPDTPPFLNKVTSTI
jgi:glucosamine--fructose-6-phosphate aminotransferase (isomerizing)